MPYKNRFFRKEIFTDKTDNKLLYPNNDCYFEDCTFIDCDIILKGPYIAFVRPKFEGNITIYNSGIGDLDIFELFEPSFDKQRGIIRIVSPQVELNRCATKKYRSLVVESDNIKVDTVRLDGLTLLEYYNKLTINKATIDNLNPVYGTKPKDNQIMTITDSIINGEKVYSLRAAKTENKTNNPPTK